MNPEKRIKLCRLIEKLDTKEEYSNRLGIQNVSTFHGELISKVEVRMDDYYYDSTGHTDIYAMGRI